MTTKSMMVRVGADTKDMERGLSSAQKKIKAFHTSINQVGKRIMVAGAAVAGAVGLMVKNYVKAGDEVHKMALRTGFTTESLSELRYASQICGADLGALEKGVKKMSKTIMDANDGLATYVRAFDRIGLKAKDLIDLSPEEQFDKIARAIARLENPTLRAATAQEIFGRAGTQLLPLFAEGEAGLEKLRKKAHELGIVFDQEAANRAAKLNDAITTLKASVTGISMKLAEKLVPALTVVADHITDVFVNIRGNAKTFSKSVLGFFKAIVLGAEYTGLAFHGIQLLIFQGAALLGELAMAQIKMLTAPLQLLAKIPGAAGEPARLILKEVGKVTGDLATITAGYNDEAFKQASQVGEIKKQFKDLLGLIDKAGDAFGKMGKKTGETLANTVLPPARAIGPALAASFGVVAPAAKDTSRILANVVTEMEDNVYGYKRAWQETMQTILAGAREITGGLDAVFSQFHANEAMRIDNEEKKKTDAIESWFEREREKIEATITNEEEKVAALEALDEEKARRENALQHKMDKERRKLERKRAKAQKASAKFAAGINVAEAITKALTAGPLIGQILSWIVAGLGMIQISKIAAMPLPALRRGGRIEKAAIVGEEGPELFMPGRSGTIYPLHGGARMAGAFTFSPIVNIYTKSLDDYAINHAAEKIFAALEKERERFG